MPLELLLKEAKGMTDEALMVVVHYMHFLKIVPTRNGLKYISLTNGKEIYRRLGIYKDQIFITDDFDTSLNEFEVYM